MGGYPYQHRISSAEMDYSIYKEAREPYARRPFVAAMQVFEPGSQVEQRMIECFNKMLGNYAQGSWPTGSGELEWRSLDDIQRFFFNLWWLAYNGLEGLDQSVLDAILRFEAIALQERHDLLAKNEEKRQQRLASRQGTQAQAQEIALPSEPESEEGNSQTQEERVDPLALLQAKWGRKFR